MALEISQRSEISEELAKEIEQLKTLLQDLKRLADEDIKVFEELMAAYKLPKLTKDEQENRKSVIAAAVSRATDVPLDAAAKIIAALEAATRCKNIVKKKVVSDVYVGADLLVGSLSGVLRNVDINSPSLTDPVRRTETSETRTAFQEQGMNLYKQFA